MSSLKNRLLLSLLMVLSPIVTAQSFTDGCEPDLARILRVDRSFRVELSRLEGVLNARRDQAGVIGRQAAAVKREVESLYEEMSFRERHLFSFLAGVFGGDTGKMARHARKRSEHKALLEQLDQEEAKVTEAERNVGEAIRRWLEAYDSVYKELHRELVRLYELVCEGTSCLAKIDQAISDVDSAQTEDMIAGFTDSKFLEIMAASDTRAATASLERAKEAVVRYRGALAQLKSELQAHHLDAIHEIEGVDPTMQLVFDFVFDSSLMDFWNSFKLSDMSSKLGDIKERVESIHQNVTRANDELVERLNSRICAVRGECQRITLE